jgi:hypothetical protein
MVPSQPGQIVHMTPSRKYSKKGWQLLGMAQIVQHLPSKHENLNSIPSATKKKENQDIKNFKNISMELVAHSCHPNFMGGKDLF